jgi:hypothetical protein
VLFDENISNGAGNPSGRFIVGMLEYTTQTATDNLDLAVSNDWDATHGFTEMHKVNVGAEGGTAGNNFADYPRAGFNADALIVSFNMFSLTSGTFVHPQVWTASLSSLTDANSSTFTTFHSAQSSSFFTMAPAVMHSPPSGNPATDPAYFVIRGTTTPSTVVSVVSMTNVLSNTPTLTTTSVTVPSYRNSVAATQPGGTFPSGTGAIDFRILNAAWRNNILVADQTTRVGSTGSQDQATWYQFNTTSTPTLTMSGNINPGTGVSTLYPSIDIDANNNLGMTYLETSSTEFLSMYVTGRKPTDTAGTMGTGALVAAGNTRYTGSRGGDFSGTSVDPSTGTSFWSANEYSNSNVGPFWSTYVASFSVGQAQVVNSGSVVFQDGGTTLATVNVSSGSAATSTSALAAGSHTITATYTDSGSTFNSSFDTMLQTVNGANTTVSSSADPSTYGQSVSFTANVSTPQATLTPGTGYNGLLSSDSNPSTINGTGSCNCQPPDTIVAAGPADIVEMVNTTIEIRNKSGTLITRQKLGGATGGFFSSVIGNNNSVTDPFVVYDADISNGAGNPSGRFIVGMLDYSSQTATNFVDIAVSNDWKAADGFTEMHRVNVGAEGTSNGFADYPRVGYNADAFFVTFNMFALTTGQPYQHVQVFAASLASLTDANSSTFVTNHFDEPDSNLFTLAPAAMHGAPANGTMYFVTEGDTANYTIDVVKLTNYLSGTPTFVDNNLPVASYLQPTAAPQSGGTYSLQIDSRVLNVAWRNNILVADQNVFDAGADHARWYQLSTASATPTLSQEGDIAPGGGIYTMYPAIDIDANNNLGLTYMESSSSEFVSMYVTGRAPGDPVGTMVPGVRVAAGGTTTTNTRGGDFAGMSVDPSTGTSFWGANEFFNNSVSTSWSTFVSNFTVAPGSVNRTTGTVQFQIDGVNFGSPVSVSAGTAASGSTATIPAGSHAITANYSDTTYGTSTGSLTQVVSAASTSTSVSSSANPSVFGQAVTFSATVSNAGGTGAVPTGSVQFVVDGSNLGGPVALDSSGHATSIGISTLAAGSHTVTVTYTNADGSFSNSSGSLSGGQTVNAANTTTALGSSANPSAFGQAVTFTATVTANSPSTAAVNAGTVTFQDGATILATANVNASGVATFSTSSLAAASHTITATYNGTTSFNGSSASLTQVVTATGTTTSVSSSANPSVFGQAVTFTATVSNAGGTGPTPTGSVQFIVDGSNLGGPVALDSSGHATSIGISTLAAGSHTVSANYVNSDGNFSNSSGSLVGGQTVNPASTATAVSSSANPSVFGQAVTFSATVSNAGGTGAVPTGSVQFVVDGSNLGGPVALDGSGNATSISTSTLAAGSHTVTVTYTNADGNFSGSSGSLSGGQTVNAANTTTALGSSVNPSVFGQSVTFTATVTANAPSTASVNTGSVVFKDGATTLGTVTVNASGVAAFTTSATQLAAGSHSITASYSDGVSFNSSSGSVTQVVNAANTTTALASSANPSTYGSSVTFTATVTANSPSTATVNTGTVTFLDGATILATVNVNASGVATFATTLLTAGSHTITANYNDGTSFSSSTASRTQMVNQRTLLITANSTSKPEGNTLSFAGTELTTAGAVNTAALVNGDKVTGVTLASAGAAAAAEDGSYAITPSAGVGTGLSNYNITYVPGTLTVLEPAIIVTATPVSAINEGDASASVEVATFTHANGVEAPGHFTATVDWGVAGHHADPGTITQDGSGTYHVAAARPVLSAGTYTVVASISEDNASTTVIDSQLVNKADTSTAVVSSVNPSVFGQSVTFTATVSVNGPGSNALANPTGVVTFYDNGVAIGTGNLSGTATDTATFTTSTLSTATHPITAAYTSGDANFNASAPSSVVNQVVNKANTTTAVVCSVNPSVFGQSETITATVSINSPGGNAVANPTGIVSFYDGANLIGTGSLSTSGAVTTASFTTSQLSTLSHTLTATYGADANFNGSSGTATQVVNKDSTTTTVTASPSSASYGQTVTFTASVTANAPGSGTPGGTVNFFDTTTSTSLGTLTLSGGQASLSTSTLAVGTHTITATYSGDPNFLASSGTTTVALASGAVVLNPTLSGSLSISGNGSLQVPGSVTVDPSSSTALSDSGNGVLTAGSIPVVGGFSKSGNAVLSPAPVTGVAHLADPLGGLPIPPAGAPQAAINRSSGTQTITPGIYPSIVLSGSASLVLSPGVYVMAGGGLSVSGSASITVGSGFDPVTGHGVLIYNAGSNFPGTGGNFGGISLSGTGTINLKAPDQGVYAGLAIFQARDNNRALSLSGQGTALLNGGSIYAKAALLTISGQAKLQDGLVVDRLQISGNGARSLAVDGGTTAGAGAGELLGGSLWLYVNDPSGYLSTDALARLSDAITGLDTLLAPYSVIITQVSDPGVANLVLDTATTTVVGGQADGVLGVYVSDPATGSGEITLVQGWSSYTGTDAGGVPAGQYDFQTIVTHELGHALGLGHNPNTASVMYYDLADGTSRRTVTVADLNIGDTDGLPDALHAAPRPEPSANGSVVPDAAQRSAPTAPPGNAGAAGWVVSGLPVAGAGLAPPASAAGLTAAELSQAILSHAAAQVPAQTPPGTATAQFPLWAHGQGAEAFGPANLVPPSLPTTIAASGLASPEGEQVLDDAEPILDGFFPDRHPLPPSDAPATPAGSVPQADPASWLHERIDRLPSADLGARLLGLGLESLERLAVGSITGEDRPAEAFADAVSTQHAAGLFGPAGLGLAVATVAGVPMVLRGNADPRDEDRARRSRGLALS